MNALTFTLLSLALAGCGARTGLNEDPALLVLPDGEVPECLVSADCADEVACTLESCELGHCARRVDPEACTTGSVCSVGHCDSVAGCSSRPVSCGDGVACTVDSCTDPDGCRHEPDESLCPISHRCDPVRGCVAQALIHDSFALYQVDLPSGDYTRLTSLTARLTDIALGSGRRLFGVNFSSVFEVDEHTGTVRPLFPSPGALVALEEGPGGVLFGAGQDDRIVAMDRTTGASHVVAHLPAGWVASGDIAFVDGRMLVTATQVPSAEVGSDMLAEIDLSTGSARLLGEIGYPCIWAVAAFGPTLYGFSCHGDLLRIDPFTGLSEHLRSLPLRIGGAAAR